MPTNPSASAKKVETELDKELADAKRTAAQSDFQEQIDILRAEIAKVTEQLARSGDVSMGAVKKATAAGVDQLKAQGQAAMDGLRANAHDLEGQLAAAVREKPVTALALAAGAGFLLALMSRR